MTNYLQDMYLSSNTLILDIETDGLNPTKIWCCSSNLFSTVFSEAEFKDALASVSVDTIVAHNGIAFDFPVAVLPSKQQVINSKQKILLSKKITDP